VETLGILSGVVAIVTGVLTAVGGVVLCVLVLANLFHSDVREWFDAKPHSAPERIAG
jgi:hypothetical protein